MPNIGLIVAMRTEVPHMLKHTTGIYRTGDNAIRLAVTGIGPKKARHATIPAGQDPEPSGQA